MSVFRDRRCRLSVIAHKRGTDDNQNDVLAHGGALSSPRRASMRCLFWLMLVLLIVTLAGCLGAGETVYDVRNQSQSCSWTESSGRCEGSVGMLSGAYPESVENDSLGNMEAVLVRAEVSVDQGTVNVSVESPEGEIARVETSPGNPAMLEGSAEVSFEEFNVTFEAVDGDARGISYTIEYQRM